ncbi:MAG: helix-turn-helix domain-containing protein [Peptococcaceae bacterium]|nr:helix-turn-helix domain-containing protein [Peptococcaceae bacterium]
MAGEKVFTPKEIADNYKVTTAAVSKWIKEGKLRAIRLGKVWRIPESALAEFIQAGQGKENPTEGKCWE